MSTFNTYKRDINKLNFRDLTFLWEIGFFLPFYLKCTIIIDAISKILLQVLKKDVGIILRPYKNCLTTDECYNSQFLSAKLRFWLG